MKTRTNKTNNPPNEIIKHVNEGDLIDTKMDELSNREIEILELVAQGNTSKEICDTLFISLNTVETHRKNIIEKLKAENIANAIAIAIRKGMIK